MVSTVGRLDSEESPENDSRIVLVVCSVRSVALLAQAFHHAPSGRIKTSCLFWDPLGEGNGLLGKHKRAERGALSVRLTGASTLWPCPAPPFT